MRVLSDEERARIVRDIHQSYKEESKKMARLSNEELTKIAQEVRQDFQKALEEATLTGAELDRLSHERAIAKVEQEKRDKKLLNEMKGSFFKRLFRFL